MGSGLSVYALSLARRLGIAEAVRDCFVQGQRRGCTRPLVSVDVCVCACCGKSSTAEA